MRTPSPSIWLISILLLATLAPDASASHDADAPPAFTASEPLRRLEHDPWSGGTWIAGPGLFFRGDDGGLAHVGIREGLPVNNVHDLDATPTSVWVNTEVGPAVMDKSDGSFHKVTNGDGSLFLHQGRTVFAEDDAVWVGTNTQGLFQVDPQTLVATAVPNPINGSRFQHQIMDVAADGPLLFISATGYGLVEWDRATGETRLLDDTIVVDTPVYGRILITPTTAWVGTSGDGAVAYDRKTGEAAEYLGPYTLNARAVLDLARLGSEYWFGTEAGISRYDARTDSWKYWQGMPWGSAVGVGVVDGEVFAVTSRGYVIQYDRAANGWADAHWWGEDNVLPHNTVFACTMDGSDLLLGTGGGGALRRSPTSWQKIGDREDPTRRPLDITVWDVEASPETLWFASHKGLSALDRQSGSWSHARTDGRPVGNNIDNPVRDLDLDADGVWAATTTHEMVRGPDRGDEQPGNLVHWDGGSKLKTYTQADGLAGDSVLSVDAFDGRVWIGFERDGVDVMDAATGAVQHVWPDDGSEVYVRAIVARQDAVWVAASDGLYRIDPTTLEVGRIEAFPTVAVSSLLWDDGGLWAGAIYGGLHRYVPSSGEVRSYTTGSIVDASGLCLVRDGGVLHVGTQWGVDRLDIERDRWLPKVELPVSSPVQPLIRISQPSSGAAYAPGDTVALRGTAQVPDGAWVEVGVAGGWVRAAGTGSWSAKFPIDESFSGALDLSARVFDGQRTLAQDAVRLVASGASGEAGGPEFVHEQVLLAQTGSTIPFVVEFEPRDADVTGWVELWLPASTQVATVPLEVTAPGVLSGSSPILESVGEATYSIRVQWEDGQARLPELYAGAPAYKVTVQEAKGKPIGFLSLVRCDAGIAPGGSGEVTFAVQNTGTKAGLMEVNFAGPASAWITEAPEPFDLPPSQTHFVRMPVTVPEGTPYGPHDLAIGAGPVERTVGSVHVFTCGLVVGEAEGTQADGGGGTTSDGAGGASGRGAPHPGVLLALVALAVAWTRRGRA